MLIPTWKDGVPGYAFLNLTHAIRIHNLRRVTHAVMDYQIPGACGRSDLRFICRITFGSYPTAFLQFPVLDSRFVYSQFQVVGTAPLTPPCRCLGVVPAVHTAYGYTVTFLIPVLQVVTFCDSTVHGGCCITVGAAVTTPMGFSALGGLAPTHGDCHSHFGGWELCLFLLTDPCPLP